MSCQTRLLSLHNAWVAFKVKEKNIRSKPDNVLIWCQSDLAAGKEKFIGKAVSGGDRRHSSVRWPINHRAAPEQMQETFLSSCKPTNSSWQTLTTGRSCETAMSPVQQWFIKKQGGVVFKKIWVFLSRLHPAMAFTLLLESEARNVEHFFAQVLSCSLQQIRVHSLLPLFLCSLKRDLHHKFSASNLLGISELKVSFCQQNCGFVSLPS